MMDSIDLNFLKEDEVGSIVAVIEKDFEVKAAEKARICKLRKLLISKDQKAELLSQSPFEGSFCVLCCSKFFILINPKHICCSCGMAVCQTCCLYNKRFDQTMCLICQQQQDLMAMNCSWFYETIRRKFMEGGSQIVANSLSEYPRKNAISPYILNMVKGAQITKFRHQIEDASSSILDSLRKVEAYASDEDTKSIKYRELITKYSENLKLILHNTSQVIHITLENYNAKIGLTNQNIDLQVYRILHEEVELLVGKKINIKSYQQKLRNNKRLSDRSDLRETLEMKLATAIVEKLVYDHQQFLIETQSIQYDDLNVVLKEIVKYDHIDFEYESISQAPSRHGTIRQPTQFPIIPDPLLEASQGESDDSSKMYSLSGVGERANTISKQWNEIKQNYQPENTYENIPETDTPPEVPIRSKRSSTTSKKSSYDDDMKIDSDLITMVTNNNEQSNWLMNARHPLGSLNSLNIQSNDPYASLNKKKAQNQNFDTMETSNTLLDRENSRRENLEKSKLKSRSLRNLNGELDDPQIGTNKTKLRNPNFETMDNNNALLDRENSKRLEKSRLHSGSFRNINEELDDSYRVINSMPVSKIPTKRPAPQLPPTQRPPTQRPPTQKSTDSEFDELYSTNKSILGNTKNISIESEYQKNIKFSSDIPVRKKSNTPLERQTSQDSGIIVSQNSSTNAEPNRIPRVSKLSVGSKIRITKPNVRLSKSNNEMGSNSSVDSDPNNIVAATRATVKIPMRKKRT